MNVIRSLVGGYGMTFTRSLVGDDGMTFMRWLVEGDGMTFIRWVVGGDGMTFMRSLVGGDGMTFIRSVIGGDGMALTGQRHVPDCRLLVSRWAYCPTSFGLCPSDILTTHSSSPKAQCCRIRLNRRHRKPACTIAYHLGFKCQYYFKPGYLWLGFR
jgi:hypothetical protein